jgi:hypothetical protein
LFFVFDSVKLFTLPVEGECLFLGEFMAGAGNAGRAAADTPVDTTIPLP